MTVGSHKINPKIPFAVSNAIKSDEKYSSTKERARNQDDSSQSLCAPVSVCVCVWQRVAKQMFIQLVKDYNFHTIKSRNGG